MTEQLDKSLSEFGAAIGLPDLRFDDHGYCCLTFDDVVLNMEVAADDAALMLYSHVGAVPLPPDAGFYERLLEANFLFRGTAGTTLGVDRASGSVVMACAIPAAALTGAELEARIKGFVDMAEAWTRRIAAPAEGAPAAFDPGTMAGIRI